MDLSEMAKDFFWEKYESGSESSDDFEDCGDEVSNNVSNDASSLFGDKWSLNIGSIDMSDAKWGLIKKSEDSPHPCPDGSEQNTEDSQVAIDSDDGTRKKAEDADSRDEDIDAKIVDTDLKSEDVVLKNGGADLKNDDVDLKTSDSRMENGDANLKSEDIDREECSMERTSVSGDQSESVSDVDQSSLDLSNVQLEFDFNIDLSSIHLDLSELDADPADSKSDGETFEPILHISDEKLDAPDEEMQLRISEDQKTIGDNEADHDDDDDDDRSSLEVELSDTGTLCSETKTVTSEEEPDEVNLDRTTTDVADDASLFDIKANLPDVEIDLGFARYKLLDDEVSRDDVSDRIGNNTEYGEADLETDAAAFRAYTAENGLVSDDDASYCPNRSSVEIDEVDLNIEADDLNPVVIIRQSDVDVLKSTDGRHSPDVINEKSDAVDDRSQSSDVISKIDLTFDWGFLEAAYESSPLFRDPDLDKAVKGHLGSLEDNRNFDDQQNNDEPPTSPMARSIVENKQLITEMRTQNYDVIRFATYRTACKLRFLQKRTNLHLVDIWNMIEAFRENGLNSLDNNHVVTSSRLESLLTSIFYHLNKRLPNSSQIDAEQCVTMLHSWIMSAYDQECQGKIRVFSIKVALATLCSGKLMDKLRYIFTQLVDSSGHMIWSRFEDYLHEVLALPTAVFEKPSFGYNDTAARSCFDMNKKVTVNDFLDTLMTEPGPQCLMWQPILNRMATVENVRHPVQCEGCHRESFKGFRYKCERCYNYQLCQDCFWRGRTSGNHSNDHEVKEYSSYSSPAKELSQSLKKSFRCIPTKANQRIPHFPEEPEKTINLTHIVPPTPPPIHNGFNGSTLSCRSIGDASSMDSSSATKSPSKLLQGSIDSCRVDDEHRLIARYAARLAADANNANVESLPLHMLEAFNINQSRSPTELNYNVDANKAQRDLVMQLEAKNREIMREIQRLRLEQEKQAKVSSEVAGQQRNPTLLAELRLLRQRRDELEARMTALQESRRELMVQLEGLMKLLKSHVSPRSTPNSSPRARTHSPPLGLATRSTPSTPGDTLAGLGSDVRQAFTQSNGGTNTSGSARSLRDDLLVAADSVTNAMSSLVKELNSEASSGSEDDDDDNRRYRSGGDSMLDELTAFREEMQQKLQQESEFLRELQARKSTVPGHHRHGSHNEPDNYAGHTDGGMYSRADDEGMMLITDDAESFIKTDDEGAELYDNNPRDLLPHRYTTDEESCLETDQESYIRTDDEEGGNTEWEDAMRRWVNR